MASHVWRELGGIVGAGVGAVLGGPVGAVEGWAIGGSLGRSKDKDKAAKLKTKNAVNDVNKLTNEYEQLYQTAKTKTDRSQRKANLAYNQAFRSRSGGRGFLGDDTLG